jgi:hypothetical protein
MSMVFKEALTCYYSELGHHGFYYPSKMKGIIKQNSEYDLVNWLSGTSDSLIAIKIRKKNILPLTLNENGVKMLLSTQPETTVVWILKYEQQ